jgi:uncharacterized protein
MSGKQARAYALSRNKIYCNYCPGYCCYRLEKSTLYLNADDINRIARYLSITDGEVRKKYIEGRNTFKVKEDNSCIFLSDGKMRARCSIHSARPLQCRQFPYEEPCPYLEREDLLSLLQPYIEKSLVSGE